MKPILFEIPIPSFLPAWLGGGESLVFPSYYVMLSISFMVAIILAVRYGEKNGLNVNHVLDVCLFAIIGVLIGMRLFFVIQKWEQYLVPFRWDKFLRIFKIWEGGIVLYGGMIGGILFGLGAAFWRRMDVPKMMDVGAMPIGIGMFFTRIGCFLNGCCHGKLTLVPWGVSYPPESLLFKAHKARGWLPPDATGSLPVHPSQLYESFMGLVIFAFLAWFWRRRKFDGQIFSLFGMIYAVQRFIIEFTRGDTVRGFVGPFSTSQFVGIFFFTFCLILYIVLGRRARRKGLVPAVEPTRSESAPPVAKTASAEPSGS